MRRLLPHFNIVAATMDCVIAAISLPLALQLRLGDVTSQSYLFPASASFAVLVLGLLLVSRTYRRVWRYTSLNDLFNLTKITTIAWLIFYLGLFLFTRLEFFPRSAIFIHWLSLLAMLSFVRVASRAYFDRTVFRNPGVLAATRIPVVLVGAGPEAEMFIRESQRNGQFPYEVAAILDDDERKRGREIHHVRIYGPMVECNELIGKLLRRNIHVQRLIICDNNLPRDHMDALVDATTHHGVTLARLPRLSELRDGQTTFDVRPVAVEDILGRPQVALDMVAMRALVHGKRVMITGAGGSIGSELVRQIASHGPAKLVLYEISEFQLYEIDHELSEDYPDVARMAVVGDVRDYDHLARCVAKTMPEVVFHAAAIKHVPMAEKNTGQAVLTNVLGSKNVVDVCAAHQVATLVQISTDKAVNPTSIMGASKRIAEIYAQMRAQHQTHPTRIITVRFGNVLGSNGSVVPLFQRQIAKGGPVTVTHPDMTRYVMTIAEAVQLVLQAAALGTDEAEEQAPIYVLEMGKPIKILDLACQMIRLAGLNPYDDIDITFTGIRPGEKLYEELFHDEENLLRTAHGSIRKAQARVFDEAQITSQITALIADAHNDAESAIRSKVSALVPEYTPFNMPTLVASESSAA